MHKSTNNIQVELLTMAVFVIRKEGEGLQEPPPDIIIIEGVQELNGLTSVASAFEPHKSISTLTMAYEAPVHYSVTSSYYFSLVVIIISPHKMFLN
uniref:Uncharacterized protein n=1 Tax=Cyprinodon variegatus TaxID=28743 RepID=A0A3Q2GRN9_CYPVA